MLSLRIDTMMPNDIYRKQQPLNK